MKTTCKVCVTRCIPESHVEKYTVCVTKCIPYEACRTVCCRVPHEECVTCTRMVARTVHAKSLCPACNTCNTGCDTCGSGLGFGRRLFGGSGCGAAALWHWLRCSCGTGCGSSRGCGGSLFSGVFGGGHYRSSGCSSCGCN